MKDQSLDFHGRGSRIRENVRLMANRKITDVRCQKTAGWRKAVQG